MHFNITNFGGLQHEKKEIWSQANSQYWLEKPVMLGPELILSVCLSVYALVFC